MVWARRAVKESRFRIVGGLKFGGRMITQELVKELFEYRDGELYRKVANSNRVKIGDKVGTVNNLGYLCTQINGKIYKNHRLIFLMFKGYLPKYIDHINGIKTDNRIENLRECTSSQNNLNRKQRSNNTSGVKGVMWHKRDKKWEVRMQINGKYKYFGRYHDIEVAKFIADTTRHKFHGEFANHGV